ncbi:hypothetical protein [Frigidibacter mobilis]|uniref:hypothetical protein n=1 Tax=Frigidibacter mobilis TaxID=1335048 RepID=UPI0008307011|nr:hypothetical protein [Frigidibacter mobilis]
MLLGTGVCSAPLAVEAVSEAGGFIFSVGPDGQLISVSLLAQLGDPNSATNIGALVPFFVMVFLAKGFVAATPLIVRGISWWPRHLRSSVGPQG